MPNLDKRDLFIVVSRDSLSMVYVSETAYANSGMVR